jgi:hypothetical protein
VSNYGKKPPSNIASDWLYFPLVWKLTYLLIGVPSRLIPLWELDGSLLVLVCSVFPVQLLLPHLPFSFLFISFLNNKKKKEKAKMINLTVILRRKKMHIGIPIISMEYGRG